MNTDRLRPIGDAKEAGQVKLPDRPAIREPLPDEQKTAFRYPLRGTPVRLLEPTKPAVDDQWEALE